MKLNAYLCWLGASLVIGDRAGYPAVRGLPVIRYSANITKRDRLIACLNRCTAQWGKKRFVGNIWALLVWHEQCPLRTASSTKWTTISERCPYLCMIQRAWELSHEWTSKLIDQWIIQNSYETKELLSNAKAETQYSWIIFGYMNLQYLAWSIPGYT